MKKAIRIGGAGGFWGDSSSALEQLVHHGNVDYIMNDYLAELTMAIMAKQRDRNPQVGYATDFITTALKPVLREIVARKIKICTNAGGVNPDACAAALTELAREEGVELSIAVVKGDDLMLQEDALRAKDTREMWTGETMPQGITSMNAYIGAFPIAAALDAGADIVITGRAADSALALGPLIHEFGWGADDYDRLAAGTISGHLIECGTQVTGGIFTDWETVTGRDDFGYPIAECYPDGTFRLTKPANTGGLITPLVAAEQVLYEVGDPRNYLLPDVSVDLSDVTITQDGENAVLFENVRGHAPTNTYKVTAVYKDGYRAIATLTMIGRDATEKARVVGDAILARVSRLLRTSNMGEFTETNVECIGSEVAYFGAKARDVSPRESVLRIAVRHPDKDAISLFAREIAPFGTAGTPGTTGFAGRPTAQQVYRLWSYLADKEALEITVTVNGRKLDFAAPRPGQEFERAASGYVTPPVSEDMDLVRIPLRSVAVARSGDKGDVSHLALIARDPAFYDVLRNRITPEVISEHFAHLAKGKVERFDVPGISAINFLLHSALGGGGTASLRSDALGKAFGEIALDMEITVPRSLMLNPNFRQVA